MKIIKKVLAGLVACALMATTTACSQGTAKTTDSSKVNLVASFYPMYILTKNLSDGIDNVSVTSMADMKFGCIHDYTMKTTDLKNIENATAFIENGFNLEAFNDKIEKAYPKMPIIKASEGIDVTKYGYEKPDEKKDTKDDKEDADDCCGGNGINPHLWTDINLYIEQVKNVSAQLQKIDSKNSSAYSANCDKYVAKLTEIKTDADKTAQSIKGKHALVLDETLPDFCHSLGIDYDFMETDHDQEALAANEMKKIVDEMKEENTKAILITKATSDGNAKKIAEETGADIYKLNSCMIGEDDIDSYIKDMKENIKLISAIK